MAGENCVKLWIKFMKLIVVKLVINSISKIKFSIITFIKNKKLLHFSNEEINRLLHLKQKFTISVVFPLF